MKWYNSIEIIEHLCVWSHMSHHLGMDNSKAAFHGIQRSSKSPYFWMYSFNTSVFTTFLKGPCRADQLHVVSRFLWWICKLQAFLTIASSDVNRRIRHFSTRLERVEKLKALRAPWAWEITAVKGKFWLGPTVLRSSCLFNSQKWSDWFYCPASSLLSL